MTTRDQALGIACLFASSCTVEVCKGQLATLLWTMSRAAKVLLGSCAGLSVVELTGHHASCRSLSSPRVPHLT